MGLCLGLPADGVFGQQHCLSARHVCRPEPVVSEKALISHLHSGGHGFAGRTGVSAYHELAYQEPRVANGHALDQQPWEYFFHQSPKPMVNDKISPKVLEEYLSLSELNKKTKKGLGYI